MKECVENSVMTFPIKKRINTELFIDRAAARYTGETRIRVGDLDAMSQSTFA